MLLRSGSIIRSTSSDRALRTKFVDVGHSERLAAWMDPRLSAEVDKRILQNSFN